MDTPKKEKTFVVSLKGVAPWISKVCYKKDEKDLRLYFTIIVGDTKNSHNSEIAQLPLEAISLPPLSGKLLTKLEYWRDKDLYYAVISQQEWQDCQANTPALRESVKHLQEYVGQNSSLLLMYEDEKEKPPKGLFWSTKKEMRHRILAVSSGHERGNWVLLSFPEHSVEMLPAFMREAL